MFLIKGWRRESGDAFFQRRRREADTANATLRKAFYKMMKEIALEMNTATGAFSLAANEGSTPRVLDLCMAPGGYSAAVLALNPTASVDAICLHRVDGGHKVLIPWGRDDTRVSVTFTDITMLANEYGVEGKKIPTDHPDAQRFTNLRPYRGKEYDLVLCDGQVLRTHERETSHRQCEPTRLMNAQLILALQRIKPGGTLLILLHKLEIWPSMMLVRSFCSFATVELFKPKRAHVIKSSFYMVAKNVQPQSREAKAALELYKELWHKATFGDGLEFDGTDAKVDTDEVEEVLDEFGPKLAELGRGIWKLQADALEEAPFMQG